MPPSEIILSICIPTYNRRERVAALVRHLLAMPGAFEICVHVDGSTDGTIEELATISDTRLVASNGPNGGRANAMLSACRQARGRFILIFDDDDTLSHEGLQAVLDDCAHPLPDRAVGYIYHLVGERGDRIGDPFPMIAQSNFLALRADHGVRGDKKELVLADALKAVIYDGRGRFRRVPTSLIWSRLALRYDVICRDVAIGRKLYLAGGMTNNINKLKARDAYPMALLYATHVNGFVRGRYRSPRFLAKAIAGVAIYGARAAYGALRHAHPGRSA
ncbi:MAG: glycosyltransferase family 2 protein [Pseudomonadota bacterium]